MILTDTEDLEALRAVARDFLAGVDPHAPLEREARVDRALWARACQELGMAGLDVPEELGGLGLGPAANSVLLEECARVLAALPLLGSVVRAQGLLLAAGDRILLEQVLPSVLDGSTVLAVADRDGDVATTARRQGSDWVLHGTKVAVLDGVSADLLLVVADTGAGASLFLVDATQAGRAAAESLDLTRDFATVRLEGVPGTLVGAEGGWPALAEAVAPAVTLAVAAEAVGSAETCLWSAVSYAKDRVQFGREIGSFQAIKHALAEVAVGLDDARSALEHAQWAANQQPDALPLAAAVAAATATEVDLRASAEHIQVHGGIGFTWEHRAHLYFRRARSNAALFGDVRHHREDVLRLLGVTPVQQPVPTQTGVSS